MPASIPGPGRIETLRRLLPIPFTRFPGFLFEMTARYGNVIAFELPWRKYVFINEPALIKDVYVTQQHKFSKSLGARMLRYLLGEGLLTSEDPKHKQMRRIVQPAFHRERIAAYMRTMDECTVEFAQRIRPGEAFDIHAAMTELTLRIATLTLFGSDESGSAAIVGRALTLMMEEFPAVLGPFGSLAMRLPLPRTRRFESARKALDEIVYALIARRRSEGVDRGDALSMLIAASDAETGYRPTDQEIRDEVITLFLAGHETTANALTWTFYLLAQHPEVDERLGAAANQGDRDYVMRVVRESMRLYPPAWIVGRETKEDVTLVDGTQIPAHRTVFVAPLVLHRRPDIFADPDRFDPDRWVGWEPEPFAYGPFGGGARRCIGEEFAWNEAALILSILAKAYRFERTSDEKVGLLPLVTLRPSGPVEVRAVARARAPKSSALASPA